ncbi:MAG: DUF3108 domain-containing protein [Pseudomonadales bacterium]|nr:DUF3108 domain-containing protein [Pseudomonadales bacterium]
MTRYFKNLKLIQQFLMLCLVAIAILGPTWAIADNSSASSAPIPPTPYQASYKAKINGTFLTLKRTLKQLADGHIQITTTAKTFYASFFQRSVFELKQGVPSPLIFDHQQKMLGVERGSYGIQFEDEQARYQKGDTKVELNIPAGAQDILSVQYMLRNWLPKGETEIGIPVVSRAKLKQYKFKITGEAVLNLPAGRFNAIKVERVDTPDKQGSYWFAKDWNYMLLKMEMPNGKGKTDYLELSSAVVGGRTMMGR